MFISVFSHARILDYLMFIVLNVEIANSLVRYVRNMPKIKSIAKIDFIVFLTLLGVK